MAIAQAMTAETGWIPVRPCAGMMRRLVMFALVMAFAAPVLADHIDDDIVFANWHPCAEDSGGVGSCTANEIDIAMGTSVSILNDPEECDRMGHNARQRVLDNFIHQRRVDQLRELALKGAVDG